MAKHVKVTLLLWAAAAASWAVFILLNPAGLEPVMAVLSFALTIAAVCSLAVSISRKVRSSVSPYLVFAVTDILIGVCVAAYAVYDIQTSTGWFAGLVGVLLLIFVVPITAVFLLADIIVWLVKRPKQ
ncbi:hypothetical protein [Dysosmobacter sp.]|uniref:hypothetical protein n=1 Tax=Dysosmobacter sp. TaxID=2591382 RepID=UPI002A89ECD3|nr:hypothetical protein [Dysosmobacter sp.]MDY3281340.1 hypothetical protein [Dysosmobacter sp.]